MNGFTRLPMLALALCAALAVGAAELKKKAVVFMMDGCRADAVDNLATPTLDKLRSGTWQQGYKGFWSDSGRTVSDARAASAPNHCSIATGVKAAKHGVYNNGETKNGHFKEWPSWLQRVVTAMPDKKALFAYGWGEGKDLCPFPELVAVGPGDWLNFTKLPALLSVADIPDAIMIYINMPDGGGHGDGYYPHMPFYAYTINRTDSYIGTYLDFIAKRPQFQEEDWLVVVVADHGGYHQSHGVPGGQDSTIPFIMAGRELPQGKMAYMPSVCDVAPTVMAHFGLDVKAMNLDGQPVPRALTAEKAGKIQDGMAAYIPWNQGDARNLLSTKVKPAVLGTKTKSNFRGRMYLDTCLSLPGGAYVEGQAPEGVVINGTEALTLENGNNFTLTFWARLPEKQDGDAVIFGNKPAADMTAPGFLITASRKPERLRTNPGVCFHFAQADGAPAYEFGPYDIEPGCWTFYAVSISPDGIAAFYQGARDHFFYRIVEHAEKAAIANGRPWYVSQAPDTQNKANLKGELEDTAIWTRCLTPQEIRAIYEDGRNGIPIQNRLMP